MNRVETEIDGSSMTREVMHSDAALRRKIPDRVSSWRALRDQDVGRKLVRGVDQSAGRLEPRLESPRFRQKIPAENHGRDARSGKRSSANRVCVGLSVIHECAVVRSGSVRLPQGHEVHRVLKLPAEYPGMNGRCEDLSNLYARREEAVVGTFCADTIAEIREKAVLPASLVSHLSD